MWQALYFSFLIYSAQIKTPKFSKGAFIHNSYEIEDNALVCTKQYEK